MVLSPTRLLHHLGRFEPMIERLLILTHREMDFSEVAENNSWPREVSRISS